MKRLVYLSLAAMMALAAFSCDKNKPVPAPKDVPEGAVDLGIVMTRRNGTTYRLYWAISNLNVEGFCETPDDRGDFYAWGETAPKSNYDWPTYKFGTSGEGPFSKYNKTDNKNVLDLEDDAPHEKLGGKWRMPTEGEWAELKKKCNWDWTDDYNGTGGQGIIVKAKNGNSIFLPAAGSYTGSYYDSQSGFGDYWTSSLNALNTSPATALYVSFSINSFHIGSISRSYGYTIRPVWEE